jgi:hypothetical protein
MNKVNGFNLMFKHAWPAHEILQQLRPALLAVANKAINVWFGQNVQAGLTSKMYQIEELGEDCQS